MKATTLLCIGALVAVLTGCAHYRSDNRGAPPARTGFETGIHTDTELPYRTGPGLPSTDRQIPTRTGPGGLGPPDY